MKALKTDYANFREVLRTMPPEPVPAKIWPIIEVPKCEDIPCNYPGPMGVPLTFLSKVGGRNDGSSGFLIIDCIRPKCRGKDMYQRLVIVNTRFCSGLFQVYKKADGTYITAEKLPAARRGKAQQEAIDDETKDLIGFGGARNVCEQEGR